MRGRQELLDDDVATLDAIEAPPRRARRAGSTATSACASPTSRRCCSTSRSAATTSSTSGCGSATSASCSTASGCAATSRRRWSASCRARWSAGSRRSSTGWSARTSRCGRRSCGSSASGRPRTPSGSPARVDDRFVYDRQKRLEALWHEAQRAVETYDPAAEAQRLAERVRETRGERGGAAGLGSRPRRDGGRSSRAPPPPTSPAS